MGATRIDPDDLAVRASAAAAGWAPGARVTAPAELRGGASSLTFVATVEGPTSERTIVLKVAPPGLEPVRNRDVLRQARLLRALAAVPGIAVPRVLFEDAGAPPEVPPLYAMTFVEGESVEPHIDDVASLPPATEVNARARTASRMLAALHAAAPEDLGLSGEPEITAADEIERWVKAFGTVEDGLRIGSDECAALLRKSLPVPVPSTIVHGDWRLGNMLCRGSDVRAVIDWEIWARSDPRLDLAWFLLAADPEAHPSAVRDAPGMPRPPALLADYERAHGPVVGDVRWFTALAFFKMAATTALIVKNQRKRGDPQGFAARGARTVPVMIERALGLLD